MNFFESPDGAQLCCPLCAGPLTAEDLDLFVRAVGEASSRDDFRRRANERASMALAMALDALGTEARAFRRRAVGGDTDPRWNAMADQADEDGNLLRLITQAHHPLLGPDDPAG